MPLGLFGNKFTPKKTPPRRAQSLSNLNLDADQSRQEFGVDGYSGVKLNLGGQEVAFENGMWVTGVLDCSDSFLMVPDSSVCMKRNDHVCFVTKPTYFLKRYK